MSLLLLLGIESCGESSSQSRVAASDPFCHDFGTVFEGEVVRHDFSIRNNGVVPIRFSGGKSTCGCVRAAAQSINGAVLPGSTAAIPIELETLGRVGRQSTEFVIETEGGSPKEFRLKLTGLVTRFAEFEPTELRLTVDPAQPIAHASARMSWPPGAVQKLDGVTTSQAWISASITSVGANECTVEVSVLDGAPVGQHNNEFVAVSTPGSRVSKAFLPIKIQVTPPISIEPAIGINFGTVDALERVERTVILRPRTIGARVGAIEVDLRVVLPNSAVDAAALGFEWHPGRALEDGAQEVLVAFRPSAALGSVVGRFLIRTAANQLSPVSAAFRVKVDHSVAR